jgi:hypothetical protein
MVRWRLRRPAQLQIGADARHPVAALPARASTKIPSAVSKLIPSATRGPKKRSRRHPAPTRPSKLAPPSIDAQIAASRAVMPRSVSNAERCVIAPFRLIELTKRIAVIIQNAKEPSPCCQDIPVWAIGAAFLPIAPCSRMERQLIGSPSIRASAPSDA